MIAKFRIFDLQISESFCMIFSDITRLHAILPFYNSIQKERVQNVSTNKENYFFSKFVPIPKWHFSLKYVYLPRHSHAVQNLSHSAYWLLQHAPPSQSHPALLFSSSHHLSLAYSGNPQTRNCITL